MLLATEVNLKRSNLKVLISRRHDFETTDFCFVADTILVSYLCCVTNNYANWLKMFCLDTSKKLSINVI